MKRRLLIFDLGFYQAMLLREIDRHGGYFLCRMKKDGNPTVIRSHRRRCPEGIKLRDLQNATRDDILDVEAEMIYQARHQQRPFVTTHPIRWRCVAVHDAESGKWHRYVTNMPPTMLMPEQRVARAE